MVKQVKTKTTLKVRHLCAAWSVRSPASLASPLLRSPTVQFSAAVIHGLQSLRVICTPIVYVTTCGHSSSRTLRSRWSPTTTYPPRRLRSLHARMGTPSRQGRSKPLPFVVSSHPAVPSPCLDRGHPHTFHLPAIHHINPSRMQPYSRVLVDSRPRSSLARTVNNYHRRIPHCTACCLTSHIVFFHSLRVI